MATKVLLIEDDHYMVTNLAELLGFEGFEVEWVNNGTEALTSVSGFAPDIILSDMHVPGMDGLAILKRVRANPATGMIPFVFLTGSSDSDELHRAMKQGADAYLIKPFKVNELLDVINRFVE